MLIDFKELIGKKLEQINISSKKRIALYGTGIGADYVVNYMNKNGLSDRLKYIIDRDEVVQNGKVYYDYKVSCLSDVVEDVDVILICAIVNYRTIYERVSEYCKSRRLQVQIYNVNILNSETGINEYVKYIEKIGNRDYSDSFIKPLETSVTLRDEDPKVIAWYLPQYHQMDINDRYHGKGFTEWTNTSQTFPMFAGHYQPHIPYDVGYYDLDNVKTWEKQIKLAKQYGIYGFSFYFYWFSGKRIMEKPVNDFLSNKDLHIPFCLTWANENWSALWDSGNNELIYEQQFLDGDDEKMTNDLKPFFSDERYIKIDGKPVFIIYRGNKWSTGETANIISNIRERVRENGIGELFVIVTNAHNFSNNIEEIGADAMAEFPPHGINKYCRRLAADGYINPDFKGEILDIDSFISGQRYFENENMNLAKVLYRGAMPSWDNTSRKGRNHAVVFHGGTPNGFEDWVYNLMVEGASRNKKRGNYIFINAWNEWAEGCHLEPDVKYGYGNLRAITNAIERFRGKI